MSLYNEKIMEHFLNPLNVGTISNASGIGEVGSDECSDVVRLYLDIENEVVKDSKFETYGCPISVASSSAVTELIKGKNINELINFRNEDIVNFFGGIPEEKLECSNLAQRALKLAIEDYYKKEKIKC